MKKIILLLFICIIGIKFAWAQSYLYIDNGETQRIIDLETVSSITFNPIGFYASQELDNQYFYNNQSSNKEFHPIKLKRTSEDSITLFDVCDILHEQGIASWSGQNILRGRVGLTDDGYSISCSPNQEVGYGNLTFIGYDKARNTFSTAEEIIFNVSKDLKTLSSDGFAVWDSKNNRYYTKYQNFEGSCASSFISLAQANLSDVTFISSQKTNLVKLTPISWDSIAINNVSESLYKIGVTATNDQNILRGRVGIMENGFFIACPPNQKVGHEDLVFVGYDNATNTYSATKEIIFYVSNDLRTITSEGFGIFNAKTGTYFEQSPNYSCIPIPEGTKKSYFDFSTAEEADAYLPYRAILEATHSSAFGYTTVSMHNIYYGQEFYGVASSIFEPNELFNELSVNIATSAVKNAAGFKMDFTGMYFPQVYFDVEMMQTFIGTTDYPGHFDMYVSNTPIETLEDLEAAVKIGSSKDKGSAQELYVTDMHTSSTNPIYGEIPREYWGEAYVYIVNTAVSKATYGEPNYGIVIYGYGIDAIVP